VLSGAGFQFEEFRLSPWVGVTQIWGQIIRPGGWIIHPLRDLRNSAKDLARCHPDMGPDNTARGQDNPPPFEISEKRLRTQHGVTQ
jgi:hypothetical protein